VNSRNKKLEVLRLLSQESNPTRLPELLKKLGRDFKERTVRRWLNEMVLEGLVEKTGHKRSTKYRVIGRNNENNKGISSCFSSESLKSIEYVRKPIYERKPTSYNESWFESYKPNFSFYLSKDLRKQLQEAGKRFSDKDPAGTYAHKIFNRLLIDLSYNSSRLEGNTYSLLDTARLVISGESAEGKLDFEKVMILNHKEAIRYLVENSEKLQIDQQTICTLHYLLSDGIVENKYAGKVRDHWVRIIESTYIPFEDAKKLQFLLNEIANKAKKIKDPFEQSLFLLIHISYLQAFSDVNKRTARLSANIPLIIKNFVPLSFNDVDRENYISATIAIYELLDVKPITDLFVFSYMRTCAAYDATIKAMGFDEVRVRYRKQRRGIIRDLICKKLFGKEMLNYIESEMKKEVPLKYQSEFMEDILEDLEGMDKNRIAGLGITPKQLDVWLKAYRVNRKESSD
jgi:Fic family protein